MLVMKTATIKPAVGVVKEMHRIREEISKEIQDMTFAEQRAYLDKLLNLKKGKKASRANMKP
jgi:hypothetical protein